MHPLQGHLAKCPNLGDPPTAPLDGKPVQLREQRWDLPVVENGIAIWVKRPEHGKRRRSRPSSVISHGNPRPALPTTSPWTSRLTLIESTA